MEKFDFAKYYDITDIAKKRNKEYNTYEKIFLCVDTNDFWLARIQKDINKDYAIEKGKWLVERDKINKHSKAQSIEKLEDIYKIADNDEFENWDIFERESLEDCLELLNGGFGLGEIQL